MASIMNSNEFMLIFVAVIAGAVVAECVRTYKFSFKNKFIALLVSATFWSFTVLLILIILFGLFIFLTNLLGIQIS